MESRKKDRNDRRSTSCPKQEKTKSVNSCGDNTTVGQPTLKEAPRPEVLPLQEKSVNQEKSTPLAISQFLQEKLNNKEIQNQNFRNTTQNQLNDHQQKKTFKVQIFPLFNVFHIQFFILIQFRFILKIHNKITGWPFDKPSRRHI